MRLGELWVYPSLQMCCCRVSQSVLSLETFHVVLSSTPMYPSLFQSTPVQSHLLQSSSVHTSPLNSALLCSAPIRSCPLQSTPVCPGPLWSTFAFPVHTGLSLSASIHSALVCFDPLQFTLDHFCLFLTMPCWLSFVFGCVSVVIPLQVSS